MTTTLQGVKTSPVNMANRKELGIKAGDTVKVHQRIIDEKGKARIQVFEGTVLARKHGNEPGATFTVRRVASGVGVEKIFPLYSPTIDKIEIVKRAKVRRAKLYYIREKVAREIKRQMRRMSLVSMASESESEAAARAEQAAKEAEENAQKEAEEKAAAEAKAAQEATAAEAEKEADEVVEEKSEAETTADAPAEEPEVVKEEDAVVKDTEAAVETDEAAEEKAEKKS